VAIRELMNISKRYGSPPVARDPGVLNLRFVLIYSTLPANFRAKKDTSKLIIPVWFKDLKFLLASAAVILRASNPPH